MAARNLGYAKALKTLNTLQRRAHERDASNNARWNPRQKVSRWLEVDSRCYIHVAGTKGKGTTCFYAEDLIRTCGSEAGKPIKTGCLTSPHVMTVRERIRIDTQPVSEECFASNFWDVWTKMRHAEQAIPVPHLMPPRPGYPSFVTLLAFHIFVAEAVDVAILETGIGGETDSTNVITSPVATGITELGMDHTNKLGNSLESIAWHKSGIFKPGALALSVPQQDVAAAVLRRRAQEKNVELHFVDEKLVLGDDLELVPNETFQRQNAALALGLAQAYFHTQGRSNDLRPEVIRCLQNTSLPAKFETIVKGNTRFVISSAHNQMSVAAACSAFANLSHTREHGSRVVLLFSHESYREASKMLTLAYTVLRRSGRPFQSVLFCPEIFDHLEPEEYDFYDWRKESAQQTAALRKHYATWESFDTTAVPQILPSVRTAIDVLQSSSEDSVVLVLGSAYASGMARHALLCADR